MKNWQAELDASDKQEESDCRCCASCSERGCAKAGAKAAEQGKSEQSNRRDAPLLLVCALQCVAVVCGMRQDVSIWSRSRLFVAKFCRAGASDSAFHVHKGNVLVMLQYPHQIKILQCNRS